MTHQFEDQQPPFLERQLRTRGILLLGCPSQSGAVDLDHVSRARLCLPQSVGQETEPPADLMLMFDLIVSLLSTISSRSASYSATASQNRAESRVLRGPAGAGEGVRSGSENFRSNRRVSLQGRGCGPPTPGGRPRTRRSGLAGSDPRSRRRSEGAAPGPPAVPWGSGSSVIRYQRSPRLHSSTCLLRSRTARETGQVCPSGGHPSERVLHPFSANRPTQALPRISQSARFPRIRVPESSSRPTP